MASLLLSRYRGSLPLGCQVDELVGIIRAPPLHLWRSPYQPRPSCDCNVTGCMPCRRLRVESRSNWQVSIGCTVLASDCVCCTTCQPNLQPHGLVWATKTHHRDNASTEPACQCPRGTCVWLLLSARIEWGAWVLDSVVGHEVTCALAAWDCWLNF